MLVDAEQTGLLIKRADCFLQSPQSATRLPFPFPVKGFSRPRLGDQGRNFVAGVTGAAPGADIGIGQSLSAMFGTGDLGEVEAGQLRELASGQARILTDLAEPTAKCLLGALRLTGHGPTAACYAGR